MPEWRLLLFPDEERRPSKTGVFGDFSLLDDPKVEFLAAVWRVTARPDDTTGIWTFTYPEYMKVFKKEIVGLRTPEVVPYQMRHIGPSIGVATRQRSLAEVQRRGRWAALRSVQRYGMSLSPLRVVERGACGGTAASHGLRRSSPGVRPWPLEAVRQRPEFAGRYVLELGGAGHRRKGRPPPRRLTWRRLPSQAAQGRALAVIAWWQPEPEHQSALAMTLLRIHRASILWVWIASRPHALRQGGSDASPMRVASGAAGVLGISFWATACWT